MPTDENHATDHSRSLKTRVTLVGALVNLLLAGIKIVIGVIGHSQALVADGVHSLSDLLSDAWCCLPLISAARRRMRSILTVMLASKLLPPWSSASYYCWSPRALFMTPSFVYSILGDCRCRSGSSCRRLFFPYWPKRAFTNTRYALAGGWVLR